MQGDGAMSQNKTVGPDGTLECRRPNRTVDIAD